MAVTTHLRVALEHVSITDMKSCPACNNSYDDATVFCPVDGSTLLTANAADDLVGSVIADRYLVTGKIGEGGMGRVYLAQHVRLPQKVAIKVLHPSLSTSADMIARFNREALNASSISNEHVARVYDFGEMKGMLYLAMEFVEGETLGAMLNKTATGWLPLDRVARIVRKIADGLDAAHKLGIVHRDLKPDNIIISSDGDRTERLKIVDFGIAKAAQVPGQSVTQTGFSIGTAEFMSPEQLMGLTVDQRSDVYALGLVTFLLLTGKLPFQGETKDRSLMMRLTHQPKTLTEVRPDVMWDTALQDAVSTALARDMENRYNSAGDFARALDSAIVGAREPVAVPRTFTPPAEANVRPSAQIPIATRSRRSAWIAAAVAMSAAIVGALVVFVFNGNGSSNGNGKDSNTVQLPPVALAPAESSKVQTPVKSDSVTASGGAGGKTGKAAVDSPPVTAKAAAVTPPVAARGSAPPLSAEVKEMLDQIEFNTDMVRMNQVSARQALIDIAGVLPKLSTRRDSGQVEMQRIEAHIFLNENAEACAYIKTLLPKANTVDLRALRLYESRCR